MATKLPARAARRFAASWAGLRRSLPALSLSLGLLLAAPAMADWLSLKDGGLIETKGPWHEKGKMVVYTSVTGPLVSIRSSEVDLPMSQAIGGKLQKTAYIDLGVAVDPTDPDEQHQVADERGDAEKQRLQNFVQDPNAPRVAGTLSAQSNEAAGQNLSGYLAGDDDAEYHREAAACSRFEGSAAGVCVMRAGIASELRKEKAQRARDEAATTLEPAE